MPGHATYASHALNGARYKAAGRLLLMQEPSGQPVGERVVLCCCLCGSIPCNHIAIRDKMLVKTEIDQELLFGYIGQLLEHFVDMLKACLQSIIALPCCCGLLSTS